jgi:hypothetical protein
MKHVWRRRILAASVMALALVGSLAAAGPARAQTVVDGTLAFSGDAGDWITGGQSYSYATASGDILGVSSAEKNWIGIGVNAFNGDWWSLDLQAPAGQTLAPGTYSSATRYPFNGAGPGLSLSGNGRGCNTLTGSFTVINAVFGPNGYVQTFDATFEQHCEGGEAAARGEVHIANPAPPPVLTTTVGIADAGTVSSVSGDAIVHGTVTCNKPTSVSIGGTVSQVVKRVIVRGTFSSTLTCTAGAPVNWTARVTPGGSTPFVKGDAQLDVRTSAVDADYGTFVAAEAHALVKLTKD